MVVFQLSNCNAYIINKCKGKKKKVEEKNQNKTYKQYPTIPAWLKQQVALIQTLHFGVWPQLLQTFKIL